MADVFQTIETAEDIEHFLDEVNGLHDAYLIGVEYVHKGHSANSPWIDPTLTELRLRYLVTSIFDAVVELAFSYLDEWQIKDNGTDIIMTEVSFTDKGWILWIDDDPSDFRAHCSYVIAKKMKWRFVTE